MLKVKSFVLDYLKSVKESKIRLIIGVLTTVILYVVSSILLFSGINKNFIIYSGLCVLVGCFIVFPKMKAWYVNAAMLIVYLLIVPKKMFERIELPTHTMERIQPGVYIGNIVIILFVFFLCLLIFQRVKFALGIGSSMLLLIFLINYFVVSVRGTSITFNDLLAVRTAAQVAEGYKLSVSAEAWYSILYFLFFIFWGFWIDFPGKKVKYHIIISVIAITGIGAFIYFWKGSDYFERYNLQGHYWNMADNQQLNGFLLSFGISIREGGMEKPDGYSEDRLDKIAKKAEENYESDVSAATEKPNVIFIMNESWSELKVLGEFETSEPYMPFIDSLDENTIKGNVHVGILGGLTANSEFEVLTGDSLTFLAPGAIPYQLQVNHDIYALPRVFKDNGYQTYAMHPNMYHIWNRENVYNYMGFDDFIDVDDFETEYLYERHFLSDECNYNEIIWQYEHRDESKPWFLFNVTIQNHGDYYGGVDMPIHIDSFRGETALGYLYDVETYLNLVKISDDAFAELIEYFSNVSEPTIICMFGDHQPSLGNEFYSQVFEGSGLTEEEKNARKYITPYLIWSNYDIEEKEYGDISANYLGAVLMEYAGLELPPYYKMLLNLKETYPVISSYTINDIQKDTLIQEYKMMQYQHLIEKNYNSKYFSAK